MCNTVLTPASSLNNVSRLGAGLGTLGGHGHEIILLIELDVFQMLKGYSKRAAMARP